MNPFEWLLATMKNFATLQYEFAITRNTEILPLLVKKARDREEICILLQSYSLYKKFLSKEQKQELEEKLLSLKLNAKEIKEAYGWTHISKILLMIPLPEDDMIYCVDVGSDSRLPKKLREQAWNCAYEQALRQTDNNYIHVLLKIYKHRRTEELIGKIRSLAISFVDWYWIGCETKDISDFEQAMRVCDESRIWLVRDLDIPEFMNLKLHWISVFYETEYQKTLQNQPK